VKHEIEFLLRSAFAVFFGFLVPTTLMVCSVVGFRNLGTLVRLIRADLKANAEKGDPHGKAE
jgi:hypothetical protein